MLYVPQVGIINPSEMGTDKIARSRRLGRGRRTRHAHRPHHRRRRRQRPEKLGDRAYPDLWLLILGAMFILVTLFMPKGIVGLLPQLGALKRRFFPPKPDGPEAVQTVVKTTPAIEQKPSVKPE